MITLIAQGGLHEGLQNIIATPFLCIYAILCLRDNPRQLIKSLTNILIILFLLNLTVFNPYIMQYKIAWNIILFFGHIHVAAAVWKRLECCVVRWITNTEKNMQYCCVYCLF